MTRRKTLKEIAAARTARRANIRRGIRIAVYEMNQLLAERGQKIELPAGWIDYTVAIAEGNRAHASDEDRAEASAWSRILYWWEREARAQAFLAMVQRVYGAIRPAY